MISNRKEALEICQGILTKQKLQKKEALSLVLEEYRRILEVPDKFIYKIIRGMVCKQCGGVLLKQTSVLPSVTCGGNPVVGCPRCGTMSSAQMISERDDFVRTVRNLDEGKIKTRPPEVSEET